MKKLFLMLFGIMCLSAQVQAQFEKGTKHWGATVNLDGSNTKYDYPQGSQNVHNFFTLAPSVQTGWMFADNKMFGVRLTSMMHWFRYRGAGQDLETRDKSHFVRFTASPFLRHYKTLSPKWALYLHSGLNLNYNFQSIGLGFDQVTEGSYGAEVFVIPGVSFAVTPRFSLEADVNLLYLGLGYNKDENGDGFHFNTGINSSVGGMFGIRAAWYLH